MQAAAPFGSSFRQRTCSRSDPDSETATRSGAIRYHGSAPSLFRSSRDGSRARMRLPRRCSDPCPCGNRGNGPPAKDHPGVLRSNSIFRFAGKRATRVGIRLPGQPLPRRFRRCWRTCNRCSWQSNWDGPFPLGRCSGPRLRWSIPWCRFGDEACRCWSARSAGDRFADRSVPLSRSPAGGPIAPA